MIMQVASEGLLGGKDGSEGGCEYERSVSDIGRLTCLSDNVPGHVYMRAPEDTSFPPAVIGVSCPEN